ncbi:hypothetical protein [Paenibacillus gansuensis]|uniref:Uncharacterized protein n=1 Tax=Paenibacillus gansuensis TaxID=306542 RepID=A0ABW5PD81_9BACL
MIMTLTMFRFNTSKLKWQIFSAGLTLAPISTLIHYKAYSFLAILQILAFTFLIWLVIKVNIGYAAMMAVSGFFLSSMPDLFVDWYYERILGIQVVNDVVQRAAVFIFNILVIILFKRFRIGFTFIPQRSNSQGFQVNEANNQKLVVSILVACVVALIGALFVTSEAGQIYLLLLLFSICLILSIMFRLYYVKEMED